MLEEIYSYISKYYRRDEYPALGAQLDLWRESKPFAGFSVLDATPVFTNSLVKYLPLLAGGAKLSVGIGSLTPVDPNVVELLRKIGIPIVSPDDDAKFDVIMDCAGVFSNTASCFGYVELTRSGLYHYRGKDAPVFFADSGRIKFIETTLGTGEGYLRAMHSLGYSFPGKKVLIFGGGKVGCGVAAYVQRAGADAMIADISPDVMLPAGVKFVPAREREAVVSAVGTADYLVSATGVTKSLAPLAELFSNSRAIIANMGVSDEFGAELPQDRVLNEKRPLNFILPEPTSLKYIDPTLALDNAGALELIEGKVEKGVHDPDPELENRILDVVRRDGVITEELQLLMERVEK